VWQVITKAAKDGNKFPQSGMWNAIDCNLPEKSSAVKVVVQSQCFELLNFSTLNEWKRLSKIVARGAFALFSSATEGWCTKESYQPFELVGKRSSVTVPEDAREEWDAALKAHAQMLTLEDFSALSPEEVGGIFLLTHTPDNWVKVVESFGIDYWWMRVLHLSIERNVNLRISDFSLVKPTRCKHNAQSEELAQRQISTIVALKVAIFYKKRYADAPALLVTRHDLEQAKRRWLARPQARKRRFCNSISEIVSSAMNSSNLKELHPRRDVLRKANAQREIIGRRIDKLDKLVRTSMAWKRAIADHSVQIQQSAMQDIKDIQDSGGDPSSITDKFTSLLLHKKAISQAKESVETAGLVLDNRDSIWSSNHASVVKLVAVGAGYVRTQTEKIYVGSTLEFKQLFGNGKSGECGIRGTSRAATLEMQSLADRLLALLVLDFKLRSSTAHSCPLPLELREDLSIKNDPPTNKPPAHLELYNRALKQQVVSLRQASVFEESVTRSVCHAIRSAFYGCMKLVAPNGPLQDVGHRRAALNVINCMLTIAACFDGLVSNSSPEEEIPIVVYNTVTKSVDLPYLESAVARAWPAMRILANAAAECESWIRNPKRSAEHCDVAWWITYTPEGLKVFPEHKSSAILAVHTASTDWWDTWPPSREQVTTRETTATAIKWGGRSTATFLGISKPCQFMGTPPFYGFVL
tara:strand:- start:1276 stop:3360 length:2085 start_codon:yes stop_codon:yes gene_type:complete